MRRIVLKCAASFGVATSICAMSAARGDIFVLANEGQVSGTVVNKEDADKTKVVIRTAEGAVVTVERSQIKQIIPQSANEIELEKIRPTFADTAEDQWKLAEWCREHNLTKARQTAMERVIELDPEHKQAHVALGYVLSDGKWALPDQLMRDRGFVRFGGRWLYPQELEVIKQREQDDKTRKEWVKNLKIWRAWLDDPLKAEQAREEMGKIYDPLAVPALTAALNVEKSREVCSWYIQALARIGVPALPVLVEHALSEPDDEIRHLSLEYIVNSPMTHEAVAGFVVALKSPDNVRVNRAGHALGKLGDKSALGPLIEALLTTHKFQVIEGSGNPNGMSAGFSPNGGGGGMSMGGGVKTIKKDLTNQQVLDALIGMGGGVNFGFDKRAWQSWYATQKKLESYDARRD